MRNKKDNYAYVQDIRDAIDKIVKYAATHTVEEFASEGWDQAAETDPVYKSAIDFGKPEAPRFFGISNIMVRLSPSL